MAGSVVPAAPQTTAQSLLSSSPPVLPPLFGSPVALGPGNSPVQVYVQVPGLPPVQPVAAVPAITTTGVANPNTGLLQSHATTLSLGPAAQPLGEIATPLTTALPTSPAGTPVFPTSAPGSFTVACLDMPPPQSAYTCAEQAGSLLMLDGKKDSVSRLS